MKTSLLPSARKQPRILIVDDDPDVRNVVGEGLKSLGYNSSCCAQAEEALEHLSANKIDILLTDYKMSEMTGVDLAQEARKGNSMLPIILMTGFMRSMHDNEMRLSPIDQILEKPFTMDHLGRVIKTSLSHKSDSY